MDVTYHGIDTGLIEVGDDLVGRILESAADSPGLADDDVVTVASKVVSIAEGRVVDLETVDVSPGANRIAEIAGLDEREVELVLRESKLVGSIPVGDVIPPHLIERARETEQAGAVVEETPSLLLTIRNGRLCTNAGVDQSNSPPGTATLLPDDPDESARRIRKGLQERGEVDVAVVLTDSEASHRGGTVDVAIGCAGIDPSDRDFGSTDLYETPTLGGVDLIGDEIAAGAALLSGQTDQRVPVVIVRGLEYEAGDGFESDVDLVQNALLPTFVQSLRVRIAEHLPM